MKAGSLAKKMRLKPGYQAAIIGAPETYQQELAPLPAGVEISKELKGKFDWVCFRNQT
jgi:hypothetical protein